MNNSQSISILFGVIVGIISLTTALLLGVNDTEKLLTAGIISIFSSPDPCNNFSLIYINNNKTKFK